MRFKEWIKKINLKGFWEKNAFYIILAVCIVVMGAVAWTSRSHKDVPQAEEKLAATPLPEWELAKEKAIARYRQEMFEAKAAESPVPDDTFGETTGEMPDAGETEPEEPAAIEEAPVPETPVEEPAPDEAPAEEAVGTDADQDAVQAAAKPSLWQCPMAGDIITAYAADRLIYWETLGVWRAHPAIDIKPGADPAVFAAEKGKVSQITEDPALGYMVVIDHGGGLQTCYASLAEDILVKEGQLVLSGQQIGSAGRSAGSEQALGTHLHFAVWRDGVSCDPLSYICAP